MKRGRVLAALAVAAVLPLAVYPGLRLPLATEALLHQPDPEAPVHDYVRAVAFDRAGRVLSIGSEGRLRFTEARSGRSLRVRQLAPEESRISAAQFDADAGRVAIARLDGVFVVWDLRRQRAECHFRVDDVDDFGFASLSLSGDGRSLAVAPAMGWLNLWDLPSGIAGPAPPDGPLLRFSVLTDGIRWDRVALSPDGDRIIRAGKAPAELWEIGAATARPLGPDTAGAFGAAWSAAGLHFALAPGDGAKGLRELLIHDADGRRLSGILAPGTRALAFRPDGAALAAPLLAASLNVESDTLQPSVGPQVWERLFSAPAGARFNRVAPMDAPGHVRAATALAWSRDGRLLATGGGDGCVLIWDAASGRRVAIAHP